ncbi:MAG: amino acid adenylation domain-containing protein, partial [Pseudomonadales bacterium]|nr:amino acid adenylation domain-containing protein [Pseudomonadales bacterium]
SIHEQFQQQALLTPKKTALVHGEDSLSYQELNQSSNRLARYLETQGVVAGDFVGLCLDRSFDMMIGALAILKTGAAYVPLDPGYPLDRLAYMLEDCHVSIVLTQKTLEKNLPAASDNDNCWVHACLDDVDFISMLAKFSLENLPSTSVHDDDSAAESLAYVIYTSGSTGQPKGVCVYHKGVSRLCKNSNYIQIAPTDNVTHLSNVSFDAATFELWGALLNGATAVVVDRDVLLSDDALAQYFAAKRVSVMFITTALFHYYAIHRVELFKQFRVVLFGGEACDPNLVAKVYRDAKPNHLINIYGPTENTVFSLWYEITGCEQECLTVPIGRPISNTTLYVLDKNQHLMPIGVSGELYLGGEGVAKGYLNRAELTNTVFLEHSEFGRLYRTGDWVRVNTEGNVEYLGRIDDQVKIRGFRIEIGEIEKNLLKHPGVSEAIVIAREDQPGHKILVAYCVFDNEMPGQTVAQTPESLESVKELRHFMKLLLPDYMVPSAFVLLDQLPLTANGKVDKKSLPKPDSLAGDADYVEPTTYQEKILALIWSEVLGGQKVGVNDNFFELGGDSIISIQIISRAKRVGLHLQPQHLFEHPTIAELASIASSERISIIAEQGAVDGEVPMLPIQQWFMEEHREDKQHFNHGLVLGIKDGFSTSDIEHVLVALLEKHDGLRGQFYNDHPGNSGNNGDGWVQRIHSVDVEGVKLEHFTISEDDWNSKDTLIVGFANELHKSFEFDRGDLFSFGFIKTPDNQDNR